MSRPALPRPGTVLDAEDFVLVLVVQRGWSDETIRNHISGWLDGGQEFDYELDVWRYHTAEQVRNGDGGDEGYDNWWSPDGAGRSAIDVAVVSS